jgi:hypothetical protein
MAQALESDVPLWSSPQDKTKLQVCDTKLSKNDKQRLGEEWKNRAEGEHASIASFAAFTIALMSNQAPPALIQDALSAALAGSYKGGVYRRDVGSSFIGSLGRQKQQ